MSLQKWPLTPVHYQPHDPGVIPISRLHPLLRNMIWEVHANVQSPQPMIVSTAFAAISSACQNGFVVRQPNGVVSPVSLYFITIAESGERKTATGNVLTKALTDFQALQDAHLGEKLKEFARLKELWIQRKTLASRNIQSVGKKGFPIEGLLAEFDRILRAEPVRPKGYKLIVDNITGPAFVRTLQENYPCTGVFSDEGLTALTAFATNNIGNLNKAWSGSALDVQRVASDSITVKNPRITLSLMFQPGVLDKVLRRENNIWRESGLLARTLVAFPTAKSGQRHMQMETTSQPALEAFQEQVKQLLEFSHPQAGEQDTEFTPKTLIFSHEAAKFWGEFARWVEIRQGEGGYFSDIGGFASKIADNAARMAALIHRMVSDELEISAESVQTAVDICAWYLEEFKRLFGQSSDVPEYVVHAQKLLPWLWRHCTQIGNYCFIEKNHVRRSGPEAMRNQRRLDAALHVLVAEQKVWVKLEGRTRVIELNPAFRPPVSAF